MQIPTIAELAVLLQHDVRPALPSVTDYCGCLRDDCRECWLPEFTDPPKHCARAKCPRCEPESWYSDGR